MMPNKPKSKMEGWYGDIPTDIVHRKDVSLMKIDECRKLITHMRENEEHRSEMIVGLKARLGAAEEKCEAYRDLLRLSIVFRPTALTPAQMLMLDEHPGSMLERIMSNKSKTAADIKRDALLLRKYGGP